MDAIEPYVSRLKTPNGVNKTIIQSRIFQAHSDRKHVTQHVNDFLASIDMDDVVSSIGSIATDENSIFYGHTVTYKTRIQVKLTDSELNKIPTHQINS